MQSPLYLSGGSDFLINGGQSQVFTFGPEARVHSFSITIVDDDIFETDEMLLVSLSTNTTNFVDFNFAILTIEDDDSKTITIVLYHYNIGLPMQQTSPLGLTALLTP